MPNSTVTSGSTEQNIYTAITFAPVQGFIEKSRKLRDLYGSSYILSFLSKAICDAVPPKLLISPANINITRGTPNVIIVKYNFPRADAKKVFDNAWSAILNACRDWIEQNLIYEWEWNESTKSYEQLTSKWNYTWKRDWKLWSSHAWEFFWAQGNTVETAKDALFAQKRSRAWTAINWTGESSTLSGADALAIPSAGTFHPKQGSYKDHDAESKAFSAQLSAAIGKAFLDRINQNSTDADKEKARKHGEAILDPTEQLSIPELAKRLITLEAIAKPLGISLKEIPDTYQPIQRHDNRRWTGWFLGDGDKASAYLRDKSDDVIKAFSKQMLHWGEHQLKPRLNNTGEGRIVYAGGDDFLGVFYHLPEDPILEPQKCLDWFHKFKSNQPDDASDQPDDALWKTDQPITVSVGFVWAAPNVPQREVLQHCREAEKSAKNSGRDRIALRILFNDGQHLEWVCPWRFLPILKEYRDRSKGQNWTHIFNDIAVLESRHAFTDDQTDTATAIFKIYFGQDNKTLEPENWWNGIETLEDGTERLVGGLLGERDPTQDPNTLNRSINNWVINLAKLGFHLCSEIKSSTT
jgi:CRISPR-associated protein Cmr2